MKLSKFDAQVLRFIVSSQRVAFNTPGGLSATEYNAYFIQFLSDGLFAKGGLFEWHLTPLGERALEEAAAHG